MSIRINSSGGTLEHYARLTRIPELRRAGWDSQKLIELTHSVQQILQNFERAVLNRARFEAVICAEHGEREERLFEMDKTAKELFIFLRPGPARVLEEIPALIGRELTDYFFEHGDELNLTVRMPADTSIIDQALEGIWSFYVFERGMEVDAADMKAALLPLVNATGIDIVKRRFAFCVLRPHVPPVAEIERAVESAVAAMKEKLSRLMLEEKEVSSWGIVAHLAMLSALARKHNCPVAAIRSQEVFSGQLGRDLATIELLQALHEEKEFEYFQGTPHETDKQLKKAIAGYNFTFNAFLEVFGFFYDRVQIV